MVTKLRWGIMGTAKIAREKIIPALLKAGNCEVVAIASRDIEKALECAAVFSIAHAYGNYEDLLTDDGIDAVYIPLPNHLHLQYTLAAIKAGKHVLCEKPIGLNQTEVLLLMEVASKNPAIKVMEGFMYHFHPQWIKTKELIDEGAIGSVKKIQTIFTYYNTDPLNIRNKAATGGGALMDIGCYCISFPRFLLGKEPGSVFGNCVFDNDFHVDSLTSGTLLFDNAVSASFTCSTQLFPYQRTYVFGTKGRIEIDVPCNAPIDAPTKVTLFQPAGESVLLFEGDQYMIQCEAFANSILNNVELPFSLADAFGNMKVIDAIFESDRNKGIIEIKQQH